MALGLIEGNSRDLWKETNMNLERNAIDKDQTREEWYEKK
jgi:hypothetical protein